MPCTSHQVLLSIVCLFAVKCCAMLAHVGSNRMSDRAGGKEAGADRRAAQSPKWKSICYVISEMDCLCRPSNENVHLHNMAFVAGPWPEQIFLINSSGDFLCAAESNSTDILTHTHADNRITIRHFNLHTFSPNEFGLFEWSALCAAAAAAGTVSLLSNAIT